MEPKETALKCMHFHKKDPVLLNPTDWAYTAEYCNLNLRNRNPLCYRIFWNKKKNLYNIKVHVFTATYKTSK